MDGTDQGTEGIWRFFSISTPGRPLIHVQETDLTRNCMKVLSATEVGHTRCDKPNWERKLMCEFEGNSSGLIFDKKVETCQISF